MEMYAIMVYVISDEILRILHVKEDPPSHMSNADGAYNSFDLEDILKNESITLLAKRGKRAKNRVRSRESEKEISSKRQVIETTFSRITDLFPRNL